MAGFYTSHSVKTKCALPRKERVMMFKKFRKVLQDKFVQIDNRVAQYKGLSYAAKGLYSYMISLPEDWQFSEERLAKVEGCGVGKIKSILKELFDIGLLKREFYKDEKGYNRAYYSIYDFDTLGNPTLENPTYENPTLENPMHYKENNNTNKIELKTNKDIYSEPVILKAEKPKKESPFDFMAYAAEKWDKAESKLCKREEWLDFMAAKNIALKAKRKSITQKMVDLNFNELYKLNEIGENVSARLEKATAEGWQGIWFDRDSREWNKRGACFKSNVTSDTIDYGATPTDSRIAKITTTYKLN